MSGPKVVRIITREEIIAICKDHLAQLEAAVQRWETIGKRNNVISENEIEGTRARQAQLRAMLATDKLSLLQRQVPEEIAYLKNDMDKRLSEAASRVVSERLYGSRLAALAQQTLDRARDNLVLPEAVKRDLEEVIAANGADRGKAEAALAHVRRAMISNKASSLTPEQRARANRLGNDDSKEMLKDWVAAEASNLDPIAFRLEEAIQQLAAIAGEDATAIFKDRQRSVAAEPLKSRRQMLADTLMFDIGKALAAARVEADQMRLLELQSASLSALDTPGANGLVSKITAALAERKVASFGLLSSQAAAELEKEQKRIAAAAQRAAIVSALQDLGYEVRDGMRTGVPQDGKVILRRATNPEMGVEVAGMLGGGRVQFRPVRFGSSVSSSDQRKDRDIETIWCSDFSRLQGSLRAQCALKVEHAADIGAVPVLFVEDALLPEERRPEVRTPMKSRTRD